MGYKFQFVTLAGFHSLNHGMFQLAAAYRKRGMAAYAELQTAEFGSEAGGYTATKHQREARARALLLRTALGLRALELGHITRSKASIHGLTVPCSASFWQCRWSGLTGRWSAGVQGCTGGASLTHHCMLALLHADTRTVGPNLTSACMSA